MARRIRGPRLLAPMGSSREAVAITSRSLGLRTGIHRLCELADLDSWRQVGCPRARLSTSERFPPWPIAGLGVTLTVFAVLASMYATRVTSGALISPLFSAAGFSTAMSVGVTNGVTSQEGIGVGLSMIGLTVGLGISTLLCAALRAVKLKRITQ